MTGQLSLGYPPAYVGREAFAANLEAVREAVHYLGLKEVAFELDVGPSYVSDALNERDRKRWSFEWVHVLLAMLEQRRTEAADQIIRRILEPLVELSTFVLEERVELDAEAVLAKIARSEKGRELIALAQREGRKR